MLKYAINLRDLIPFDPAANETVISGNEFNLTTLRHWNYKNYSNGTISNGFLCFLLFEPYTPFLLPNGTFLNSTSCYSAINDIQARGIIGLVFTSLFAISVMFTFVNLRKHGRLFLPTEKRFRAVGRRWQWYWMLAVAGCGMASGIFGVDVDRYYLPELPIVLCSFFYFLMLPMTMAVVWESVRHWGSWQERQAIDPNPFILKQNDRRGRTEFYMPLVFYLFAFLNFFMVVPRSWTSAEKQRDLVQQNDYAKPMATDTRFKAAAFFLFAAWLVIVYSLWHSIKHYLPRNRGAFNRVVGGIRYTPTRFLLMVPLALIIVGYAVASSLNFDISVIKVNIDGDTSNIPWIYGLGWAPIALILFVQEVSGYLLPNEDRELIRQRRVRGSEIDQELGYAKKPHWWSRLHENHNLNVHEAIARNVKEVGGGRATAQTLEKAIEMGNMPAAWASAKREERPSKGQTPEAVKIGASVLFPHPSGALEHSDRFRDVSPAPPAGERGRLGGPDCSTRRPSMSERSSSTQSANTINAPPQQIRSMLDV